MDLFQSQVPRYNRLILYCIKERNFSQNLFTWSQVNSNFTYSHSYYTYIRDIFFNHNYSHHGFDDPLVNEVVSRDDRHPEPEAPPFVALGNEGNERECPPIIVAIYVNTANHVIINNTLL